LALPYSHVPFVASVVQQDLTCNLIRDDPRGRSQSAPPYSHVPSDASGVSLGVAGSTTVSHRFPLVVSIRDSILADTDFIAIPLVSTASLRGFLAVTGTIGHPSKSTASLGVSLKDNDSIGGSSVSTVRWCSLQPLEVPWYPLQPLEVPWCPL
jgi:hypothetical protein